MQLQSIHQCMHSQTRWKVANLTNSRQFNVSNKNCKLEENYLLNLNLYINIFYHFKIHANFAIYVYAFEVKVRVKIETN